MIRQELPKFCLRIRLSVARWSVLGIGASVLLTADLGAYAWVAQAREVLANQRSALVAGLADKHGAKGIATPPLESHDNLSAFDRALGDPHHKEGQLRTLFALAAKEGLVLNKGEYDLTLDKGAKLYRYKVALPVKGEYRPIWDFALQALDAIPFASLDEISFHREKIGDATVEAQLRFTLYLHVTRGRE